VKFAYTVSDFANQTGETLSRSARTTLLDLAGNLDIPVIEDTAYHALRFEGADIPALQAIDVALCGSRHIFEDGRPRIADRLDLRCAGVCSPPRSDQADE
jgi:DNA-binding transcriptional MocR family regulator